MKAKDLIKLLEKCPPNLPVRLVIDGVEENIWVNGVEVSEKGESGYETSGEIRIVGSE
jgi:hypothetical protein